MTLNDLEKSLAGNETKADNVKKFLTSLGLVENDTPPCRECVTMSVDELSVIMEKMTEFRTRAEKAEECLEKVRNFIGVAYPDVE